MRTLQLITMAAIFLVGLSACGEDKAETVEGSVENRSSAAVRPAPPPAPTWSAADQRASDLEARVIELEKRLR